MLYLSSSEILAALLQRFTFLFGNNVQNMLSYIQGALQATSANGAQTSIMYNSTILIPWQLSEFLLLYLPCFIQPM